MRVLHLVPGAPFGGAQRLTIDLAAEQRRVGVDARLLVLSEGGQTAETARAASVPAVILRGDLRRIMAMRRIVRCTEPDILHLHLPPPWLAPVLPRGRAILHLHMRPSLVVHGSNLRRRVDDAGERLVLARADRAIAISAWVEAAWRSAHPGLTVPIDVVHNGVELFPAAPRLAANTPARRPFTIAMASRLSDRKGVEEFIALASAIRAEAPDIVFRIAGDGPMRKAYEAMVDEAGLSGAIAFVGFVTDMAAFWECVDLAAFTPPFEPFGLRLIEPVAHGVPVLAYRTGSGADEVIDTCRGIRAVAYGDAAGLAREALVLRDNPAMRASLAVAGRADVAARFSLGAMTAHISAVYGATMGIST